MYYIQAFGEWTFYEEFNVYFNKTSRHLGQQDFHQLRALRETYHHVFQYGFGPKNSQILTTDVI